MERTILQPAVLDGAALAELKHWLGISRPNDDAALIGLIEASLAICEAFTGKMPLAQTVEEIIAPHAGGRNWYRARCAKSPARHGLRPMARVKHCRCRPTRWNGASQSAPACNCCARSTGAGSPCSWWSGLPMTGTACPHRCVTGSSGWPRISIESVTAMARPAQRCPPALPRCGGHGAARGWHDPRRRSQRPADSAPACAGRTDRRQPRS